MARKPSFKFSKTSSGWKVEIPAKLSSTGKRQRAFFPTRDEAKDYAAGMREVQAEHGRNATSIKPSLAEEATIAIALLEPYGISLVEAARWAVAARKAELASSAIENALASFLISKSERSEVHVKAYSYMKRDLEKSFANRNLATITSAELLAHTESYGSTPATFNALARLIGAFWRWCARNPRNWCDAKVADVLERKDAPRSETGVLNFEECKRLLHTAEEFYPECVLGFVIALFTGMRKAELSRLQPKDITADGINLPAVSTKTGRRRFIQMPESLLPWLQAYPVAETVLPPNWHKKEKAVRRQAGWKVWSDLVDPPTPPDDLPEWHHNALRHTHASVLVAMGKPLDSLTFEFGHSGGAQVLKSHYVGVMPKSEAFKIMNLHPRGEFLILSPADKL